MEVVLWQYGIVIRVGPRSLFLPIGRRASNLGKGHRGSAIQSSHLEHEALQSYDSWYEEYEDQFLVVELYWTQRVELITALKEGAAISDARGEVVTEVDPDDDEEASTGRVSRKGRAARPASSSTTTGSFLSRLSQATKEVVASLGDPPPFEPLRSSLIIWKWSMVVLGGITCATFRLPEGVLK